MKQKMNPQMPKLILRKIELKQKGWFSWLFSKSFQLKINNKKIKLKTGSSFLFYILDIISNDVNIILDVDNVMYDYSKTFVLGDNKIAVDNPCFYGVFYFEMIGKNLLLDLENRLRMAKNTDKNTSLPEFEGDTTELTTLSRKIQGSTEMYSVRNSYDNQEYFVNKESYTTSFTRSSGSSILPPGWEMYVINKKMVYVNHNLKTTHWRSPAYKLNVLREKVEAFEGLISNINFLSIRSFIPLKLNVRRGYIIQSTALFILHNTDKLKSKKLHVVFENEMGQDYGALLREFMYEASLEIHADQRLASRDNFVDVADGIVFKSSGESIKEILNEYLDFNEFQFMEIKDNKGKNNLPDELFFIYVGVFMGMSILFNETIDYLLSLSFCENLLKRNFTLRHIQDSQYQRSILWMLRNEVDEDLLPGTNLQNKEKALENITNENLFLSKKSAYDAMRLGFYSIIPEGFRDIFEAEELSGILSSERNLDVSLIKEFVIYNLCNASTQEITFLWEILDHKDQTFLRRFVKFITGSGSIPKLINNYNFRIIIEKNNTPNMLFRASACLNKLFIGIYEDKNTMERIMDFSILNTEGFHKV